MWEGIDPRTFRLGAEDPGGGSYSCRWAGEPAQRPLQTGTGTLAEGARSGPSGLANEAIDGAPPLDKLRLSSFEARRLWEHSVPLQDSLLTQREPRFSTSPMMLVWRFFFFFCVCQLEDTKANWNLNCTQSVHSGFGSSNVNPYPLQTGALFVNSNRSP